MTEVSPLYPPDGGWTVDDLDGFPNDGLRYELVDGVLLVSAAPSEQHQIALGNLHVDTMAVPDADGARAGDGAYVEVARVQGDEPCTLALPFPITMTALDLLR